MRRALLGLTFALSATASLALADQPLATAPAGDPPDTVAQAPSLDSQRPYHQRLDDGEWARRVIAGEPTEEPPQDAGPLAQIEPDDAIHGEMSVGIGTSGYRQIGGYATKRIGSSSVSVGFDHVEAHPHFNGDR